MVGSRRTPDRSGAEAQERLEGRIRQEIEGMRGALEGSFGALNETLASIQADIRRGALDRKSLAARMKELENALGENRDAQRMIRERLAALEAQAKPVTKEAVVEVAPEAAAEAARSAPREVWNSLSGFQKVVAIAAGSVAILAGLSGALTGAERLAKGIAAGVSTA